MIFGPPGRHQQSHNPGLGNTFGPKESKRTASGSDHQRVFARQEGHLFSRRVPEVCGVSGQGRHLLGGRLCVPLQLYLRDTCPGKTVFARGSSTKIHLKEVITKTIDYFG